MLGQQHTIQKDKLKIAPSKIEDGGQGLYVHYSRYLKKGETVTNYEGKIITQQEFNLKNDPSEYAVQVTKNIATCSFRRQKQ